MGQGTAMPTVEEVRRSLACPTSGYRPSVLARHAHAGSCYYCEEWVALDADGKLVEH